MRAKYKLGKFGEDAWFATQIGSADVIGECVCVCFDIVRMCGARCVQDWRVCVCVRGRSRGVLKLERMCESVSGCVRLFCHGSEEFDRNQLILKKKKEQKLQLHFRNLTKQRFDLTRHCFE